MGKVGYCSKCGFELKPVSHCCCDPCCDPNKRFNRLLLDAIIVVVGMVFVFGVLILLQHA